jgi:microcystin-dependent protein
MTQARDLGDAANKANYLDNVTSDIQAQLGGTPAGIIQPFGGTTAPTGYLACEGQLVSKTGFPDLWTAIGDTWGTSTASSFYVPDLRGAFLRGTGTSGARQMANGSYYVGGSVGAYTTDQMQDHKHDFEGYGNGSAGGNRNVVFGDGSGDYGETNTGGVKEPLERNFQGTPRTGSETIPFNAGVLYIIKT